jgi:dolichol-phosphate mannosyltransferase
VSNFKVAEWIPSYLRWYRFAFGGRLTAEEIRARAGKDTARAQADEPQPGYD